MSFEHTMPAALDASSGLNPWSEFSVEPASERLRLLRELRDSGAAVILSAPDGSLLSTSVWAVDAGPQRINFSADPASPQLPLLVSADELVAVAYLTAVKLQFELHDPVLVRGHGSCALQCSLPDAIYRFQRRSGFRVRTPERVTPTARLRHPAVPEMGLSLRVLDVSIGGCALWLPDDVPTLEAGTLFGAVQVELDTETRFETPMTLQHVSASHGGYSGYGGHGSDVAAMGGVRLGCEWPQLAGPGERSLQRWIDRTQQRRRLLAV